MVSMDGKYNVVEAMGLTKVFRDFWMRTKSRAVDDVDFDIHAHEVFGLLGPNGSGKSTIIKMILGLLHKTKGKLLVFGKDPGDVFTKRRIGFLPEESYMYRFLNPRETLEYYGRLFSLDRRTRRRRSDELLEMVGLSHVGHRPIGEFSKGMTRRIGLAQALINDPDFLILDEPTSGLDPIGTRQVKDLILELRRRGKTVLLSSHLLADVEDVCDRIVMLYGGKIRAQGTADELLADTESTLIQTPRLSPQTIDRIEELLEAEGKSIDKVQTPRQRLEDLFMAIVEQARQERVVTSGAEHGGTTAEFLRADTAAGQELIETLMKDEEAPAVGRAAARRGEPPRAEPASAETERDKVLADLLGDAPADPSPKRSLERSRAPEASRDVDRSVIDSLLDKPRDDDDQSNSPDRDS